MQTCIISTLYFCIYQYRITYYKTWIYPRKRTGRLRGANPRRQSKAVVNASSLEAPSSCCSHPPRKTSLYFVSNQGVYQTCQVTVLPFSGSIPERPSPLALLLFDAPPPPPKNIIMREEFYYIYIKEDIKNRCIYETNLKMYE